MRNVRNACPGVCPGAYPPVYAPTRRQVHIQCSVTVHIACPCKCPCKPCNAWLPGHLAIPSRSCLRHRFAYNGGCNYPYIDCVELLGRYGCAIGGKPNPFVKKPTNLQEGGRMPVLHKVTIEGLSKVFPFSERSTARRLP
jgi:hypothetical protein